MTWGMNFSKPGIILSIIIISGSILFPQYPKEKMLKKFPVRKNAKTLKLIDSFPKEEDMEKDIYLRGANYFCVYDDRIYISDARRNMVLEFTLQGKYITAFGRKGQGPGEFSNILGIDTTASGNLVVLDEGNRRIQFLSGKGLYINSFKLFKASKDIVVDESGKIYITPSSFHSRKKNLIEIFNEWGNLIGEIGKNTVDIYRSECTIAMDKKNGKIAVGWRHFPEVRIYTPEGKLVSEIDIEHKLFKHYEELNHKAEYDQGITLYDIISALSIKNNKLFILNRFPRIEILVLDMNGEITETYYYDFPGELFITSDFYVMEKNGTYVFYVLQFHEENKMCVFSAESK